MRQEKGMIIMADRSRIQKSMRLDEIVMNVLDEEAQSLNVALSRHIETILMQYCKNKGLVPNDTKLLGETRGTHDRTSHKQVNRQPDELPES